MVHVHSSVQLFHWLKNIQGEGVQVRFWWTTSCQQCLQHSSWPRLLPCKFCASLLPPECGFRHSLCGSYTPPCRLSEHSSTSKFSLEELKQWPHSISKSLTLKCQSLIWDCIRFFHSNDLLLAFFPLLLCACVSFTYSKKKFQLNTQGFLSLSAKTSHLQSLSLCH